MRGVPSIGGLVFCLSASASMAQAERVACQLAAPCPETGICAAETVALSFEIDRTQFAPPVDPKEPPRRKVTQVDLGGVRFVAEAMVIGDVRGFWEDAEAMGSRIFTMQPDGTGLYSEDPSGRTLRGPCEVTG